MPDPAAEKTSRLFLAVWPGPRALAALQAWQAQWRWPRGARVTGADRWHLTLHFIGEVAASRVPELRGALALAFAPCEIAFGRAEVWPRGLVVLAPLQVPPALADLHTELKQRLQGLGLPVESRSWRPHLTLARRAAGAVPPTGELRLRWPVRAYTLVVSEGGYRVLARYGAARPSSHAAGGGGA